MRRLLFASAALISVVWFAIVAAQTPLPGGGLLAGAALPDTVDGYGIHVRAASQHR
jgi:hypothetical protein